MQSDSCDASNLRFLCYPGKAYGFDKDDENLNYPAVSVKECFLKRGSFFNEYFEHRAVNEPACDAGRNCLQTGYFNTSTFMTFLLFLIAGF